MKKIILAAAILGIFAVSAFAFGGDEAPVQPHPLAASGFTLASADAGIRQFWIEHGTRL